MNGTCDPGKVNVSSNTSIFEFAYFRAALETNVTVIKKSEPYTLLGSHSARRPDTSSSCGDRTVHRILDFADQNLISDDENLQTSARAEAMRIVCDGLNATFGR